MNIIKNYLSLTVFLLITSYSLLGFNCKQVVIWGHKPHSAHSHSYIHRGFYKAFSHLGYKTLWLDERDNVRTMSFVDTLFITEGSADNNIPLRTDCRYVLYNCPSSKYDYVKYLKHCLIICPYTYSCINKSPSYIDDGVYYNSQERILYMPWATDLLPHEIDEVKQKIDGTDFDRTKEYCWVNSIIEPESQGTSEVESFKRAVVENEIRVAGGITKENENVIKAAKFVTAIESAERAAAGYIPEALFKNISIGNIGVTNAEAAVFLLRNKVLYNADTYELFYDTLEYFRTFTPNMLFELMDIVKNKHTYINRINAIFTALSWLDK